MSLTRMSPEMTDDGEGVGATVVPPRKTPKGARIKWTAKEGSHVEADGPLAILNGRQSTFRVTPGVAGVVQRIRVVPGETLNSAKVLADIKPDDPSFQGRQFTAAISDDFGLSEATVDSDALDLRKAAMSREAEQAIVGFVVIAGALCWLLGLLAFAAFGLSHGTILSACAMLVVTLTVWWGKGRHQPAAGRRA